MSDGRLLELIEQVYAAAGTSAGWQTFLHTLRTTLHGSTASLIRHDPQDRRGNLLVTSGADPGDTAYRQYRLAVDSRVYAPRHTESRDRTSRLLDEVVVHRNLQHTAFSSGLIRDYDLVRVVGCQVKDQGTTFVLSISRSGGPLGRDEAAFLDALLPHVRQAIRLHQRLVMEETTASSLAQTVNRSSVAMLLVTARAEVAFVNEAASRLLALRDGLVVEHGQLRTVHPVDTSRLRRLICDAACVSKPAGAGGALAVQRLSARRALAVLVHPLPGRVLWPPTPTTVAEIFVSDPDARAEIDESALRALFSLTPAESRLTALLAQGVSLTDAAAALGLRRETVRSRLKTIFQKTGTNRQAELVRLVLSS